MANNKTNKKDNGIVEPRINDELYGNYDVRVIYKQNASEETEGDFNKVMPLKEAKVKAEKIGLDLIEINRYSNPPILKIYEYSKYIWELKKTLKQKKKNGNSLKEVQLKTNISSHDLAIKANKAKEFIEKGDKVKVVLTMRGRELSRRDISKKCIYEFITLMEDVAVPESMPKDENNKSTVILKKK